MKKGLITIILVLGLVLGITGCSKQANGSNESGKPSSGGTKTVVKVGLANDPTPPFIIVDDKNQITGYDVDYLKELEKKLPDYEFKYEQGNEEELLISTDTGKYDFTANWYFKNPDREKKFIYPAHEFGYSVTALITKSDRNDIKTLDDMVGKKFPPVSPSGGLRTILNTYNTNHPDKKLTLESIDNPSNTDNLKMVAAGKADSIFLNVVSFQEANKKLNLDLKIGGVVSKEPVYFVFNKNKADLAKKIDAATEELIKDGTLPKLAEKWFNVDFFKDLDYINQGYMQNQKK